MFAALSCLTRFFSCLVATACIALISGPTTAFGQQGAVKDIAKPDATTSQQVFGKTAQPFFKKHCLRCHNEQERESGIRVDQLDGQLAETTLKLWEEISEQIEMAAMPPEEEPQPLVEAWWLWTLVGVGVAALGVGIYFLAVPPEDDPSPVMGATLEVQTIWLKR